MSFDINSQEMSFLLEIARNAIKSSLDKSPFIIPPVPEGLNFKSGCFVTLYLNGRLRGCIGNFRNDMNIVKNIADMAVQAALKDPRFPPVSQGEFDALEFEISVLSPMIPIKSVEEAEVGRDGLYVVKGFNCGVLLPQVATEYGWDKYEFISHTCAKAGLSFDAWKTDDIELYRFEAVVFGEKSV
ncbi:AmmeMemoRadiSam system protein A [Geovibrio thiophilus]|uniref:AmmeMemoRadiSam system protein A n=1 Tax=Geovibrio thiophilus TaxID=139438 RepID=A0A3R5XWG8_9BACT|nr:AmmeMemoRadiSam system protein A [Geovibrio thiophilus]QAR32830.1 AmmeMemoRadiSam system protein A [Geovibrio thiophilus]